MAVVEAKRDSLPAGAGLQQAKAYAEKLGLKFAYSTNGLRIVEFNFITGRERELESFPTPDELWGWLHPGTDMALQQGLLTPYYRFPDMQPRYYQETAINRTVEAILGRRKRTVAHHELHQHGPFRWAIARIWGGAAAGAQARLLR